MRNSRLFNFTKMIILFLMFQNVVFISSASAAEIESSQVSAQETTPSSVNQGDTVSSSVYEIENASFETGDLTGWTVEAGGAFGPKSVSSAATWWNEGISYEQEGNYHLDGWAYPESETGKIRSTAFVLSGSGWITFKLGGGKHTDLNHINIIDADTMETIAQYGNTEFADINFPHIDQGMNLANMVQYKADLSKYLGKRLFIEIEDEAASDWGVMFADAFHTFNQIVPTAGITAKNLYIPSTIENPGFETGDMTGWTVEEGGAFGPESVSGDTTWWNEHIPYQQEGLYHLDGWKYPESETGKVKSTTFKLSGSGWITFKLGGGKNTSRVHINIINADTKELLAQYGNTAFADINFPHIDQGMNLANMVQYRADLSKYLGQNLIIEIEDEATSDWGLIFADAFFTYYETPPTDGVLATNLYDPAANANELPATIQNPSFETGDLTGWKQTEGDAFTGTVTSDTYYSDKPEMTFGQAGKYHVWGLKGASQANPDERTGVLESSHFKLGGTGTISFLIGGGINLDNLYVALVRASDGATLFKATGPGSEAYQRVSWDAKQYRGQELYINIVDHDSGPFGHLNVDDFNVLGQGLLDYWSFNEGSGKTAMDSAAGTNDSVSYVFNNAKYKPNTDPQWRDGIKGKGLLFDGYSTYVTRQASDFFSPSNALTIEAWVAPRSYEWGDLKQLSAIVNQQDASNGKGFILGMGRHGSWALQAGISGKWLEVKAADDKPLEKNKWSYIVATIDNEAGKMSLYLNGQLVGEKDIPQNGSIDTASKVDLLIGKHNNAAIINGVFSANMFNGMIDEVKIYNKAESADKITANYQQYINGFKDGAAPLPDLSFDRSVYDGDQYRPQYHFIAPEHWMNEPHGPLYFDGKYHIFYQFNPQGPYWHQIHWGHAVSDDMVHWKDMPVAISPDGGSVTPDGVWSGNTVIGDNGDPMAFFTAGDDSKTPNQMVGLARSTFSKDGDSNLKQWVLDPAPVNVQQQNLSAPEGMVWYGQFRDPFVWKDGDTWYQLVASGIKDTNGNSVGGTALLYTSTDMVHWEYKGPFYVGNYAKYPKSGQVWELPVFLPLGKDKHGTKKWIMLVSPWFDHYTKDAVKHVYYWVGTWDKTNNKFIPDKEEPTEFDFGEHFTGPSGMVDPKGRTILYSIAQDERTEQEHFDAGWAHNAGLPLELGLKGDGTLAIAPIEELNSLRNQKLVSISNQSIAQVNEQLKNVKGDMLEIKMEIDVKDAAKFGINLRQSNYGIEETPLYYDVKNQTFNIDRNKSSLNPDTRKGIQGGAMSLNGETLQLHIYLDRSMIEAYANGKNSITSRVYPTRFDSLGLSLFASGGKPIVKSMEVWSMNSAYGSTVPVTGTNKKEIPHGELPNHDFQNGDVSGWIVDGEAFSPEHVTTATDWGWGGPFQQAQTASDPNDYHLWGYNASKGGDNATGTLTSQSFVLGGDGQIDFLVGGGNNPDKLYFALVRASDHQTLMKATGNNSEQYRRVSWDASQYIGETLYVQLVDNATGGFGHINLDDVNVPVAMDALYNLNGDVKLNGNSKSAVTVKISNSQGVVYTAKYGTVSDETYGVEDKVDDQGKAVSGYVHYFFHVPAGTYTITASDGSTTRSASVTTDSNDDVYQNMYQQQVVELSLSAANNGSGGLNSKQ